MWTEIIWIFLWCCTCKHVNFEDVGLFFFQILSVFNELLLNLFISILRQNVIYSLINVYILMLLMIYLCRLETRKYDFL